jgi:hypothetical protein
MAKDDRSQFLLVGTTRLVVMVDLIIQFSEYFWTVFTFWACWQICDFVLARLKVKLRKPWIVESEKSDNETCEGE